MRNMTYTEIFPRLSIIGVPSDESQTITFGWSQLPLECQITHYNILAMNCGSCPATTTNTSVTCTDTPADSSVCMFAVQTVVCGTISGYMSTSDVVSVNLSYYYFGAHESSEITTSEMFITSEFVTPSPLNDVDVRFYAALASASFLGVLLIISTLVTFVLFIILYLQRKVKIQAALELPTVTNIQSKLTSVEDINATENIAYEHNTIIRTIKN